MKRPAAILAQVLTTGPLHGRRDRTALDSRLADGDIDRSTYAGRLLVDLLARSMSANVGLFSPGFTLLEDLRSLPAPTQPWDGRQRTGPRGSRR